MNEYITELKKQSKSLLKIAEETRTANQSTDSDLMSLEEVYSTVNENFDITDHGSYMKATEIISEGSIRDGIKAGAHSGSFAGSVGGMTVASMGAAGIMSGVVTATQIAAVGVSVAALNAVLIGVPVSLATMGYLAIKRWTNDSKRHLKNAERLLTKLEKKKKKTTTTDQLGDLDIQIAEVNKTIADLDEKIQNANKLAEIKKKIEQVEKRNK